MYCHPTRKGSTAEGRGRGGGTHGNGGNLKLHVEQVATEEANGDEPLPNSSLVQASTYSQPTKL
jgi:RecA-family ATPase